MRERRAARKQRKKRGKTRMRRKRRRAAKESTARSTRMLVRAEEDQNHLTTTGSIKVCTSAFSEHFCMACMCFVYALRLMWLLLCGMLLSSLVMHGYRLAVFCLYAEVCVCVLVRVEQADYCWFHEGVCMFSLLLCSFCIYMYVCVVAVRPFFWSVICFKFCLCSFLAGCLCYGG